ncbi:peptidase inhibitor family I36 protein [Streptomyces sp. NPDC001455]|uniref:peptidase inhibitor family I36 protein n=1 Tax=unclassified Streptomyces TaxID=2593676 RepID=UPI0033322D42
MVAATTPAQAAGSCPSGNLCLWEGANYSGIRAITASTNACISLSNANMLYQRSYISHLPVTAVLWQQHSYAPYDFFKVRTLPAGGFSSDFGTVYGASYVCTNGKTP